MSNFLLKSPDCVLIHIPKTGGTSIRKGIWGCNYVGPVFGLIPDEWSSCFKFCFVRHPLQRLISSWKMFTYGAEGDQQWRLPSDARELTISAFIDIVLDESIIFDERRRTFEEKIRHHTIPQTHPFNCMDLADHVARFENYTEELQNICHLVGINIGTIPKMHFTKPLIWSEVLHGRDLERCLEYYENDILSFGYSIDSNASQP
jgi:hypothetical protein